MFISIYSYCGHGGRRQTEIRPLDLPSVRWNPALIFDCGLDVFSLKKVQQKDWHLAEFKVGKLY